MEDTKWGMTNAKCQMAKQDHGIQNGNEDRKWGMTNAKCQMAKQDRGIQNGNEDRKWGMTNAKYRMAKQDRNEIVICFPNSFVFNFLFCICHFAFAILPARTPSRSGAARR